MRENAFRVLFDGVDSRPDVAAFAGPLVRLCRTQTHSAGAYIYALSLPLRELRLVGWGGLHPATAERFRSDLSVRASHWYTQSREPLACGSAAWKDWRFESLPEFVQHRFESVLSVPLLVTSQVAGVVNLCRREPVPYSTDETALVSGVSQALGVLLARSAVYLENRKLANELDRVNQKLTDRKLIERAKGILQRKFQLTEEEAYFRLRRTSRRSREPMGTVAQKVIESEELPATESGGL